MSFQFSGLSTMSSFWRPRNTWEKSRPLTQSGWSSLPQNFSASATPRNSASKRNSRKSSPYTTNTRIQTHGEFRELSRNFTQKLPSEDIIVLLFFFSAERFTCICSCWNISEVQMMVNESCSSSHDLCVKLHVCMYYNASWSKLVHMYLVLFDGHLIWEISIPMQCLFTYCMNALKSENVFTCTRELLKKWKKE